MSAVVAATSRVRLGSHFLEEESPITGTVCTNLRQSCPAVTSLRHCRKPSALPNSRKSCVQQDKHVVKSATTRERHTWHQMSPSHHSMPTTIKQNTRKMNHRRKKRKDQAAEVGVAAVLRKDGRSLEMVYRAVQPGNALSILPCQRQFRTVQHTTLQ